MPETQQPTRAMVTAAMMASLAVVFFSLAAWVPLLGSVIRFFIAVPISLAAVLCPMPYGVLAASVAGLLLGIVFGPLPAWQFVTWFAIPGLVMGVALRRQKSFGVTFAATVVSLFLGLAVYYISLVFLLDWDIQSLIGEVTQMKDQVLAMYQEAGILDALEQQSLSALDDFTALLDQTVYYMVRLIPAMLMVMGLLQVALQHWATNLVLQRRGLAHQPFPAFRNWHFPGILVMPLLSVWALFLARAYLPWQWLEVPVLNFLLIAVLIAVIDGLAYIVYRFTEIPMSGLMKVMMVLFVIFFLNGIVIVAAIAGIFDMLLDFRQRRLLKKE